MDAREKQIQVTKSGKSIVILQGGSFCVEKQVQTADSVTR